eukprot:744940-Rhodomonas_salina.1
MVKHTHAVLIAFAVTLFFCVSVHMSVHTRLQQQFLPSVIRHVAPQREKLLWPPNPPLITNVHPFVSVYPVKSNERSAKSSRLNETAHYIEATSSTLEVFNQSAVLTEMAPGAQFGRLGTVLNSRNGHLLASTGTLELVAEDVLFVATEISRQTLAEGGWVLLVIANKAFGELTKNWVCNLKRLGLENRL